jgi:alpha-1,3-rhamnosyl/mannosyltransferase
MAKLLPTEFAVYPPEWMANAAKKYLVGPGAMPTVITIHDLSVILHPAWHPADRVREHARKLERAAANAAHIITDTEQVKREVMRELRVSASKITAIPLGVGAEFRPGPRLPQLPEQYFLCVGTIEPRKNLLVAMKAFASLPKQLREQCPLLLAGPWGWKADAERSYFDRTGQDAGIRHLGYLPDDAMPSLYSGAAAVLYPSLYEGFGLPPLEAVACGRRAICSRGTLAVEEVMGTMATYCDAHDVEEWSEAMQCALPPLSLREGLGAARFTWSRTAHDTLAVYNRVLFGEQSNCRAA